MLGFLFGKNTNSGMLTAAPSATTLNLPKKQNKEESEYKKQEKIDNVLDTLKHKYGYNSVTRAGKLEVEEYVRGKEKKMK